MTRERLGRDVSEKNHALWDMVGVRESERVASMDGREGERVCVGVESGGVGLAVASTAEGV